MRCSALLFWICKNNHKHRHVHMHTSFYSQAIISRFGNSGSVYCSGWSLHELACQVLPFPFHSIADGAAFLIKAPDLCVMNFTAENWLIKLDCKLFRSYIAIIQGMYYWICWIAWISTCQLWCLYVWSMGASHTHQIIVNIEMLNSAWFLITHNVVHVLEIFLQFCHLWWAPPLSCMFPNAVQKTLATFMRETCKAQPLIVAFPETNTNPKRQFPWAAMTRLFSPACCRNARQDCYYSLFCRITPVTWRSQVWDAII